MTNTIKIKCNAENTLELAELTEFQGGLKQRTDIDYDKIKLSICKYGFSFPFFVWKNGSKNYLLDEILNDFTEKGDIILDVFGGSGSTLIACEGTERKCLMIEMSENYCDVIRRRYTKWAKENGKPITSGCLE